jgi:hypothetical protein
VLLAGCAASEPQQSASSNAESIPQAAQAGESSAAQHSDLTGLWEGDLDRQLYAI